MMMQSGSKPVQPIVSLSPFMGNKWWIKARVTDKSDIRHWNKPNSTGKLFSCTLIDESSAIRATFFNEGVDNFFHVLMPNQIFYFSGGSCKTANRKFSSVNNEYELSFDAQAIVEACHDSSASHIPSQRYNFVPISLLAQREPNTVVDLLAVVTDVAEPVKIVQKATGNELTKRTVKIADQTAAVELTIWNDAALSFAVPIGSIIAVKSVKIGSWDGISVSTSQSSTIDVNPNVPDLKKLAAWYSTTHGSDVTSLTVKGANAGAGESKGRRFFQDIEREGLGRGEKADNIEVRCVPTHIRIENLWYDACPKCSKKLQQPDGVTYRCEKCEQVVPEPNPRYMTSIMCSDNVSQMWITIFDDAGKAFFGYSAPELKREAARDPSFVARIAQQKMHVPIIASLRVKEERFGDNNQERVKCTMTRCEQFTATPAAIRNECEAMLAHIAAYRH